MNKKEVDRLIALLGMTGSDQDGEALSAMRMANKFLKDRKLTWENVINTGSKMDRVADIMEQAFKSAYTRREYRPRQPPPFGHRTMAQIILETNEDRLTDKEKKFVREMLHWNNPTDAQLSWLQNLYSRFTG